MNNLEPITWQLLHLMQLLPSNIDVSASTNEPRGHQISSKAVQEKPTAENFAVYEGGNKYKINHLGAVHLGVVHLMTPHEQCLKGCARLFKRKLLSACRIFPWGKSYRARGPWLWRAVMSYVMTYGDLQIAQALELTATEILKNTPATNRTCQWLGMWMTQIQ